MQEYVPYKEQLLYNLYQIEYLRTPTLDLIDMEKRNRGKYTTVHIPAVLAEVVDQIIENEECAYSSRSEFIKDAVRRFLEYHGYRPGMNRNSNSSDIATEVPQYTNARQR
jgi:Arc/MetJ-type ribon-helix-helix transcriptional regulator